MADTLSEQQLAQLVMEVKEFQPRKYSPTFLKMAGFPDRENVWSNILAFYFQSTNGHGLDNAVFQAFMSLINVKVDQVWKLRPGAKKLLRTASVLISF